MNIQTNWLELKSECEQLGLRVYNKWRSPIEIKGELLELTEEAEAITALADKNNGELDEIQQGRWNKLMAEDGLVAAKQKELDSVEAVERQRKALALAKSRSDISPLENPSEPPKAEKEPEVLYRVATPKNFRGKNADHNAFNAGMFILALQARYRNSRDEKAEKHIQKIGWDIKAAATEGTATAGGYLVPDPLARSIIDIREEVGVARRIAKVWPMSSDTDSVPKRTGGLTVYAPGEGNTITTSDKTWGRVNLVATKLAVAHQISNELSEDAIINVADDAVGEMAYALADSEDDMLINGDGTSTYFMKTGLLSAIGSAGVVDATAGNDTWPEISATDVANWIGKLPSKYRRKGQLSIICSTNFYHTALLRLMIAAGGNTMQMLQSGLASDASFLGYPVYFTDKMPTATAASTVSALFGNFNMAAILGERGRIQMGRSEEYAFLDDVTTLKATQRVDINVHEPGTSSAAGGYVALKTAS